MSARKRDVRRRKGGSLGKWGVVRMEQVGSGGGQSVHLTQMGERGGLGDGDVQCV